MRGFPLPPPQGVSFTTVPIATSVLNTLMKQNGLTFEEAYGKLLGTLILCSIIPSILSFCPIKFIKKVRCSDSTSHGKAMMRFKPGSGSVGHPAVIRW